MEMFLSVLFRVSLVSNCLPSNDYKITPSKIACVVFCARALSDVCYFNKGICQFEKTGSPARKTNRNSAPGTECFFIQAIQQDLYKAHEQKKEKPTPNHGKPCSNSATCHFKDAVCFYGKCLCKLGVYFSPSQGKCLKDCDEFGSGMTIYKGAGITHHNNRSFHHIGARECQMKCVKEQTFTCLTADIGFGDHAGECYLSADGYLDADPNERDHDLPEWKLGQRNCK